MGVTGPAIAITVQQLAQWQQQSWQRQLAQWQQLASGLECILDLAPALILGTATIEILL